MPWLGDAELAEQYGQIRLDEPWDSESNRQFHERVPDVYRCPTCETRMQPGDTSYCVILGEETPFDGSGTGKTLSGFGTESGGMILVAETREPGNWMNPNFDVTFDQAKTGISGVAQSGNVIGSFHTGGANFGLRSGAVSFYVETIESEIWERVLAGKERVR